MKGNIEQWVVRFTCVVTALTLFREWHKTGPVTRGDMFEVGEGVLVLSLIDSERSCGGGESDEATGNPWPVAGRCQ